MQANKVLLLAGIFLSLISAPAYADKIKIVASFSILGDMAHEVAGDNAEVKTLVGPNGDAHTYEPSPADAKSIASADIVIVNGFGFEGWMGRLIVSSGYSGQPVIASNGIDPLQFGDSLAMDPHAWQDISNGKIYVANIRDALIAADNAHKTEYQANASRYLKQLDELDKWVRDEIAKVPAQKRTFITTHDAFQYFGKAYGVKLYAPIGMNTESEASAADIARLIDQMRKEHIKALFMENITDSRMIKQLETDADAYIGGTLYSDALSAPDGPAGSYIKMFTSNVQMICEGMLHNQ